MTNIWKGCFFSTFLHIYWGKNEVTGSFARTGRKHQVLGVMYSCMIDARICLPYFGLENRLTKPQMLWFQFPPTIGFFLFKKSTDLLRDLSQMSQTIDVVMFHHQIKCHVSFGRWVWLDANTNLRETKGTPRFRKTNVNWHSTKQTLQPGMKNDSAWNWLRKKRSKRMQKQCKTRVPKNGRKTQKQISSVWLAKSHVKLDQKLQPLRLVCLIYQELLWLCILAVYYLGAHHDIFTLASYWPQHLNWHRSTDSMRQW